MTRPAGSKNIPWGRIVQTLRSHPGRWMLLPEMVGVPIRTVSIIKEQRLAALRPPDARIRYRRRATVWRDDGREFCDIWLCYVPKEKP
jgi:hypothetical protein